MNRASREWLPAISRAKHRNGWLVLACSSSTVGLYAIYWLYQLQREHPRRLGYDPHPTTWLLVFAALTFVMLGVVVSSGYGQWRMWSAAGDMERFGFITALAIAVLFNLWFGLAGATLTGRFLRLLGRSVSAGRSRFAWIVLIVGVVGHIVAMTGPALVDVGAIALPAWLYRSMQLAGRLATGALLAWGMTLHGLANMLAERPSLNSQAGCGRAC
jgi:hypothetical protein